MDVKCSENANANAKMLMLNASKLTGYKLAPQLCSCHRFQKRLKAAEADSKLKQVYIPT